MTVNANIEQIVSSLELLQIMCLFLNYLYSILVEFLGSAEEISF